MKIHSLEELKLFAEDFLKKHPKGGVFALSGDLGAGKTTFVRQIVEILAAKSQVSVPRVTSPTYVYHQNYSLIQSVDHFDLYRMENATLDDLNSIGYEEALDRALSSQGYLFIEWPEKCAEQSALKLHKVLNFLILDQGLREVIVQKIS